MFPACFFFLPAPQEPVLPEAPKAAQSRKADLQGGGQLTFGGESFQFHPTDLGLAAHTPFGRMAKLSGQLRPASGAPWTFELQVSEKGQIMMLQCFRQEGGRETGRWSPTVKSKVEVLAFQPQAGGEVRLRFSGPVSGVVGAQAKRSAWSGEIRIAIR